MRARVLDETMFVRKGRSNREAGHGNLAVSQDIHSWV